MAIINVDSRKIRVVKNFGDGSLLGFCDAAVNMLVHCEGDERWIVNTATGIFPQISLAHSSGGPVRQVSYPEHLQVSSGVAAALTGWPNASGLQRTHIAGILANGPASCSGSNMSYMNGNGSPTQFNRSNGINGF